MVITDILDERPVEEILSARYKKYYEQYKTHQKMIELGYQVYYADDEEIQYKKKTDIIYAYLSIDKVNLRARTQGTTSLEMLKVLVEYLEEIKENK